MGGRHGVGRHRGANGAGGRVRGRLFFRLDLEPFGLASTGAHNVSAGMLAKGIRTSESQTAGFDRADKELL